MIALLCGHSSLRSISQFAQEHPIVLRGLGFRNRTSPGRSALTALLEQLDPLRLREAIDEGVNVLPETVMLQKSAFDLMHLWTLEVRHHLVSSNSDLDDLLDKLGWPGLQGWLVLAEDDQGTLSVR